MRFPDRLPIASRGRSRVFERRRRTAEIEHVGHGIDDGEFQWNGGGLGRECHVPLPAALQATARHGFTLYQRFTRGSRTVKGRKQQQDVGFGVLRAKNPAPGKRLAQGGLSKDYLHASDVRSWVRRSLAWVGGKQAGRQAGEGDARAVSFKASWRVVSSYSE